MLRRKEKRKTGPYWVQEIVGWAEHVRWEESAGKLETRSSLSWGLDGREIGADREGSGLHLSRRGQGVSTPLYRGSWAYS